MNNKAKGSALAGPVGWTPESGLRPRVGQVDEAAIDRPTRQALFMLATLCVATLLMWAAGRAACNYHVPGEGLTPRKVSLEERTRNPKAVGVELAQALSGADFETARQLVQPSAGPILADAQKCGECAAQRAARKNLLSVGEVLQANRDEALVLVRTLHGPGGVVERVFHVKRDLKGKTPWRVAAQFPSKERLPVLDNALESESVMMHPPELPSAAGVGTPGVRRITLPSPAAQSALQVAPIRAAAPTSARPATSTAPASPPATPAPPAAGP